MAATTPTARATVYAVVRDCCRSGNCVYCSRYGTHPTPFGTPARLDHATYTDRARAEEVARGWASYRATVEVREVAP